MDEYLSKKIRMMSFISILAVVLIHAYNFTDTRLDSWTVITEEKNIGAIIEYIISNGLTRFAVPLFFMISGYLFYCNYELSFKGYLYKLKRRGFSILIPYVIWSLLSFGLVYILGQVIGMKSSVFINYANPKPSIGELLFSNNYAFQLWYLKALIIFTIISPIGYLAVKYVGISFIAVLGLLWSIGFYIGLVDTEAYLFFYIGAYIAIHNKSDLVNKKPSKAFMITNLILWLAVSILRGILAAVGPTLAQEVDYHRLYLLYKIGEIFGVVSIWSLYDYLYDIFHKEGKEHKLLNIAASNVFLVFLMHEPIQHILYDILLGRAGSNSASSLMHVIVYFGLMIVMVISIELFAVFLRRFLPRTHKILTGGR